MGVDCRMLIAEFKLQIDRAVFRLHSAFCLPPSAIPLPAAHERDDFQPIAVGQPMFGMAGARHEFKIHFDRHMPRFHFQLAEKFGHRNTIRDLARLAVDENLH